MEVKNLNFQFHKNLGIVQFQTQDRNTLEYISGNEAIRQDLFQVKEAGEGGMVNTLYAFNLSEKYVFFMDGDILAGAKQNRVLNTSVLFIPNSKTELPVSCVEHGRWHRTSENFSGTDYISPAVLRAKKAKAVFEGLKESGKHMGRQGEVWDDVKSYSESFRISSKTENLSDVFDKMETRFKEFTEFFKPFPDANGIGIFINRNLLNIEIFNRTGIYNEYFPKILKGSAMEASRMKNMKEKLQDAEAFYKVLSFMDKMGNIKKEKHKGVGAGEETRFETEEVTGFSLNFQNRLVHFTALNLGMKE